MSSKHSGFEIFVAEAEARGIISIPHAGNWIPNRFVTHLSPNQKTRDRDLDFKVNEILPIPRLQKLGLHVIVAKLHRACIDLNRTREQALFAWPKNSFGEDLVISEMPVLESEAFLKELYDPYFESIQKLCDMRLPLIDLHSMPSRATAYHLAKNPKQNTDRPDFCISDADGHSAPIENVRFIHDFLQSRHYDARLNEPYKGGHITQHFGGLGIPTIQIETNRKLYMDEEKQIVLPKKLNQLTACFFDLFKAYFNRNERLK